MNMDVLSRAFDILQRAGGMEQINQLMVIVYGALCVFGILNCILGYRILRFWMMIFGFLIGAGAGFGVTYMSGVQDKMVIAGAMAGLGIVLAIVSFMIYRAGIFVLGFGIGISLSIYLVHPTSSFSFFLCILIGVGLGVLAMRYAKGVIIIGTSVLGGVLAGLSIAKIAGLAQFPYGVGMAAGIVILGMLIQFAINKDRYEDDEEDDEDEDDQPEEKVRRSGRRAKEAEDWDYNSRYDRDSRDNRKKASADRRQSDRENVRSRREKNDRDERYSDRRTSGNRNASSDRRSTRSSASGKRNTSGRNSSSDGRRRSTSGRSYDSDEKGRRRYSQNSNDQDRSRTGSGRSSCYDASDDHEYEYDEDYDRFDHEETGNTYEDFEKQQQRSRRMDIENMADYDETEEFHEYKKSNEPVKDMDLDPDDYDEWEDN